jgi:hypothetical protein
MYGIHVAINKVGTKRRASPPLVVRSMQRLRLGLAAAGTAAGGDWLGRLRRGNLDGGLRHLRCLFFVRTLLDQRLGDDLRAVARRTTLLILPGRMGHAALHPHLAALTQ